MRRMTLPALTVLVLLLPAGVSRAGWADLSAGGRQPWWDVFAKRGQCQMPEEARLQKFWHDYYDALKNYYGQLDRIDWVAYYKNHGCQVGAGCGECGCACPRVGYAPVTVAPAMQWAAPAAGPAAPAAPPAGAAPVISAVPVYSPGHK